MDNNLRKAQIVAAIIGLLDSIYMAIYKITSNNSMCLGSGDCAAVNASRYSEIYGIPLGVIGAIGMIAIMATIFLENRPGFFAENSRLLTFGMSMAGFLYVIYLTYLEIFVIKAICPFCVLVAIVMTVLFVLSLIRLVRQPN